MQARAGVIPDRVLFSSDAKRVDSVDMCLDGRTGGLQKVRMQLTGQG